MIDKVGGGRDELHIYYDRQRHIVCDPYTREDLHRAATLLGLKRCWFHANPYPHYDLPKRLAGALPADLSARVEARLLGSEFDGGTRPIVRVEQVDTRRLVGLIRGWRGDTL